MSFLNLSSFPALVKSVPRVFVTPLLGDLECDRIVSTQKIAATGGGGGFLQLFTADGGAQLTFTRTMSMLGDQQRGDLAVFQDDMKYKLEITVAAVSLPMLQDLLILDPSSVTPGGLNLKANRGAEMTSKGVSFVIYDKNNDMSNDSNVPLLTADAQTIVIFKAVPSSDTPPIVYNNVQRTAKLTFDCLVSKSSGSASGIAGRIDAFTQA